MRAILAGFLLLSTTLFGCVAKPALTPSSEGGAPWNELRSEHFVLLTDRPADEARRALTEYETTYDIFTHVVISGDLADPLPIQVVLFDREKDYRSFAPRGAGAYFTPSLAHDPEPVPTLVLWGDLTNQQRLVFQHELAHHIFHRVLGPVPTWLGEGLAEYYSTLAVDGNSVVVGTPNPKYEFYFGGSWARVDTGSLVRLRIPVGAIPTAKDLMALDRETFYEHGHEGEQTAEESKRRISHYAGSWALVHMMSHTPGYAEAFAEFLSLLSAGKGYPEALDKGLGGLLESADKDLKEYLISRERLMAKTTYTPKPSNILSAERPLSDSDVRVLWNRLKPWTEPGPEKTPSKSVKADFDMAVMNAPENAGARLYRGIYHLTAGNPNDAEADLRVALAKSPGDSRVLIAVVIGCVKGKTRKEEFTPFCIEKFQSSIDTLAKVARTPAAHGIVASMLLGEDRVEEAFDHATRSVKADPGCARCLHTLAEVMGKKGMFLDAMHVEERAIAALYETQDGKPYNERLKLYRKAYADELKRKRDKANESKPE